MGVVGTGVATFALGLNLSCQIDRAAEQQELFGQCGLAGVRMGDDGKGTPARHFARKRRGRRRIGIESKIGHGAKRLAGKGGQIKKGRRPLHIGSTRANSSQPINLTSQ